MRVSEVAGSVEKAFILISSVYLLLSATVLYRHRSDLRSLWREPVMRRPVVIIESDDWGPGPKSQVDALRRIRSVLCKTKDEDGQPAVMSLGLVLVMK